MFEIYQNLFIGNEFECFFDNRDDWAVIHACKSPCHQRALGYRKSLSSTHPNYLTFETGNHLFLNIIDPPAPLFKLPLFTSAISFIDKHLQQRKVLVHCNHGLSRAPSIGLLYLAKRTDVISNANYREAAQDFLQIYRRYQPGRGIVIYLSNNWNNIK